MSNENLERQTLKKEIITSESIEEFLNNQAQPTEEKTTGDQVEDLEKNLNPEDFAGDFEEEEEESEAKSNFAESVQEAISTDPRKEAENLTSFIDMTQHMAFAGIHKMKSVKKIGGKENWNKAVKNSDIIADDPEYLKKLSPEERSNYYRVKSTRAKIARLTLTEDEREYWVNALEGIVAENGYKMPTSALVMLATINMMIPRITDLMID